MNFTEQEKQLALQLAQDYISSPCVTFTHLSSDYHIPAKKISNILWEGIASNLFTSNVADIIYYKVTRFSPKGLAKRLVRWDEAFVKRSDIRADIIKRIKDIKATESLYEYCIDNYDIYSIKAKKPLKKDVLINRLTVIRHKINQLSMSLS